MPGREYIIFCDESDKSGPHYANFYGGILVSSRDYESVTTRLRQSMHQAGFHGEVKWQKVTDQYLFRYASLMGALFDELRAGQLKIRVMFRQTALEPVGLTPEQTRSAYYRLYYQFIKHAFGLAYLPRQDLPTYLRLYFDQFPDTGEQVSQFKGYLLGLQRSRDLATAGIRIRPQDITEVRSHEHPLLQCLDVVLGAMAFRLNDKHKRKPAGSPRRGRRTIAKEKLYKAILAEIRTIRPGFNVGITTGQSAGPSSRWSDAYRHWSFRPRQHRFDKRRTKGFSAEDNPA